MEAYAPEKCPRGASTEKQSCLYVRLFIDDAFGESLPNVFIEDVSGSSHLVRLLNVWVEDTQAVVLCILRVKSAELLI